jgi:hypothetical protein
MVQRWELDQWWDKIISQAWPASGRQRILLDHGSSPNNSDGVA